MKLLPATFLLFVCLFISADLVRADQELIDPRVQSAMDLYRSEGPEAALPQFQQLSREFGDSKNERLEAISTGYVGECHWRLGDFEKARVELERALEIKRKLGDRREVADTLNVLGLLEWDSANYQQAKSNFKQVGVIARELSDIKLEGMALNNLSLVYDELGDYQTSLKQYQQVLELYREIDFPRGTGDTLGNIGGVHLLLGHYREALEYYLKALTISEQLNSAVGMSQDHGNIALSYLGLGELESAIRHFDRAIEISQQAGLRQDVAYWSGSKGSALIQKGRYDLGLVNHRKALGIYEELGARGELLEAMYELGLLLAMLGDPASAEGYFEQAMGLAREIRQSRGITLNLMALGDLQYKREQLDQAAQLYEEARNRSRDDGQLSNLAASQLKLALVYRERQTMDSALREANAALDIASEIEAKPLEAEAIWSIAEIERRKGNFQKALSGFEQAELKGGENTSPDLLWQIHFGRARALESMDRLDEAVTALTAAVRVIEGVRDRLMESRYRTGYVQDKYEVYVELVRLQLKLGREEEAFLTAEQLRARSFASLAERGQQSALTEEEQQLESELRERILLLQNSLTREQSLESPQQRQSAIENFSRELLVAERDYQTFLDDRARSGVPQGKFSETGGSSSIRERLEPGDVLIEYVVGEDQVMMFILRSESMTTSVSKVRRADLTARVALLRDLIRRPGESVWKQPAAALADDLIQPLVNKDLLQGAREVYLVPHGVLNYLPFAVLPVVPRSGKVEESRPLLEDLTLVYLPTAALLGQKRAMAEHGNSMLAMAPASSRLRYAPEEAQSIDAMFQPRSRLLAGEAATESQFKEISGSFSLLHLATHGYFNKFNPLLSGLELEADSANDGLLEVHEILELGLNARLVTLSACETALGSGYLVDMPAGDEFVGLTRAFLLAGSNSVLATLWEVDDRSSVKLMLRFYRILTDPDRGLDLASALASAQRDLRASDKFNHPYYWAPFVLVGNSGPLADALHFAAGEIP
jgi:CHAT domain-containing protein/Tfp pilus assembly protein PilF